MFGLGTEQGLNVLNLLLAPYPFSPEVQQCLKKYLIQSEGMGLELFILRTLSGRSYSGKETVKCAASNTNEDSVEQKK